ncbi:MAG TPA: MoxR family ATPase [Planctomycetota bacterium]|nr:MoxR family ATPase [Planctomycetota bacterium]
MLEVKTQDKIKRLVDNIEKVFMGKSETVKLTVIGLFAGGHILIEDVPGVGKTILAKTLAKSLDSTFQRIQFTPDLLPSDILGVSILNTANDQFVFKRGPVFANIILADEINRTTPRTQSSLLEAMNDFQVSVDGVTYRLPQPFMVIATQNPAEYEGTYPLPESQLDRFLMRIRIGYPSAPDEKRVLYSQQVQHPILTIEPVITANDVLRIQQDVRNVRVDETISDYILEIVNRTRQHEQLEVGVSPRGSLGLFRASQSLAYTEGRDYVVPDDVKRLATTVLAHRTITKGLMHENSALFTKELIETVLETVPVPM